MKRPMPFLLAAGLAAALVLPARAENAPTGQIDFGKFAPSGAGGEFVEVNVSSTVISMAARLFEKEEPDIAKLLNGIQLVHVTVVGLNEENRDDLQKRAASARKQLEGKGWERLVTAQKHEQEVAVYLRSKNKDTIEGLAVIAMDGDKKAIFVNIVGEIKPEQISVIGEKLHIDQLKKFGK